MNNLIKKIWRYLVNNFKIFTIIESRRFQKKYPVKILNNKFLSTNPTIHFLHRYITINAGDVACGYYQYFLDDFKDYRCVVHDISSINFSLIKNKDVVIVGGGGLLNALAEWNYNINKAASIADKAIIWSAGFNSNAEPKYCRIDWTKFDLIAIRDFSYKTEFRYVPCATCMIPDLEKNYAIRRRIGVVCHKDFLGIPQEMMTYERITNDFPLQEIIEFIGSSEIILTNSYHAAYWSILMQRKCIIFSLHSEKFNYYKYLPVLFSGDLSLDISQAVIYPNALQESKMLTLEYVEDILSFIGNKTYLN